MDHRIALKKGTQLCLSNEKGEKLQFVIDSEIGRGASFLVYEAIRITDTGDKTLYRIKEFYPYKLDIARNNNVLIPSKKDEAVFKQRMQRVRLDFSKTNQLFYYENNYSSIVNQLDLFIQNGTTYILSAYSSKHTLSTYKIETLKECIRCVRQVAYILKKIHDQGYLYLDMKPDNILIVDGYQKSIQLFDFDSLFSMNQKNNDHQKISYTKGFAPIELQTSKIRYLGPYCDVYSLGALLFYLLFGYTPSAPECEMDASFNFQNIQYDYQKCDDHLFGSLTHFFHKTLAVFYEDRYQSMKEVFDELKEIEKYADMKIPRIYSTKITKPVLFSGREKEMELIDRFILDPHHNCLVISGVGGIGKSTLIRQYLSLHQNEFDTILYIYYKESVESTINDDEDLEISTLKQREDDRQIRYFDKKVQKIKELVRDKKSILVIDNFTGNRNDDLRKLLSTDLKVILISRKTSISKDFQEIRLTSLSDLSTHYLFECCLSKPIKDKESVKDILQYTKGHPLVIELIARQITYSHMKLKEAALLLKNQGFSSLAAEKIDYEKDSGYKKDTAGHIIDALFETCELSLKKKILLKVLSLSGDKGIDINQFSAIMKLPAKDDLNELYKEGWLVINDDMIIVHDVIKEAISRWKWNDEYKEALHQFLAYFYIEIVTESTKNNIPVNSSLMKEKRQTPDNYNRLLDLLKQSQEILRQCQKDSFIKTRDIYKNLLCVTVLNTPHYQEDYLLTQISYLLSLNTYLEKKIKDDEYYNTLTIMKLIDIAVYIHCNHERFDEAKNLLEKAKIIAKKTKHSKVYAHYYNILSNYYDFQLDGFYDTEDAYQSRLLDKMLKAIQKTLHYAKKNIDNDIDHLYVKNILSKATVLLRSEIGKKKEIRKLIEKAKKIIDNHTGPYSEVRLHYDLVCAWYYALALNDKETATKSIQDARYLGELIIPTDLQKIQDIIIPCANIYFELQCYKQSMELLFKGTRLCFKYSNVDSYAYIKQQLCDHIVEVAMEGKEYSLCKDMLKIIDDENTDIVDDKNKVKIPLEIIKLINTKSG